jgi:hypothetical protein
LCKECPASIDPNDFQAKLKYLVEKYHIEEEVETPLTDKLHSIERVRGALVHGYLQQQEQQEQQEQQQDEDDDAVQKEEKVHPDASRNLVRLERRQSREKTIVQAVFER